MHKNMQRTDHPRIRGEHVAEMFKLPDHPGSSPHTRGARRHLHGMGYRRRIIPAYAGSTPASPTPAPSRQDHPRIRGEHDVICMGWATGAGSSPHTRGARRARSVRSWRSWDHPRIRGEHTRLLVTTHSKKGSSPHTRGAHIFHKAASSPSRIIPAYAGSTGGTAAPAVGPADHPRIRGEHIITRKAKK